ncbi:scoloptoxin SSD14-like [Lycorma delicatula]|uniref:scoloptoxin SSD14-like n=1 Tax=Lycorma delicatula TaxID=130591 RepID=UPI003F515E1D
MYCLNSKANEKSNINLIQGLRSLAAVMYYNQTTVTAAQAAKGQEKVTVKDGNQVVELGLMQSWCMRICICVGVVIVGLCGLIFIITATDDPEPKKNNETEHKLQQQDLSVRLAPSSSAFGQHKHAAVVSNSYPCAHIGVDILKKNGSAVEAAIATGLCDGVTKLLSMGIGGGFLMTVYKRDTKSASVLIAREKAPAAANENMFHGSKWASKIGARAAGVPGELKGYQAAFEKYKSGNIEWKDLLQPTIKLCEQGVPVGVFLANNLKLFENNIRCSESLSHILLKEDGSIPELNDIIKLPVLAKTLRTIAESPRMADELYNGTLTDAFVEDIKNDGGIITKEDMSNYRVQWADPITRSLSSNLTIYTVPPPGSGALLAFILQVLDGFVSSKNSDYVINLQRMIETFKHAYGRRTEFGDPKYVNISNVLEELSSDDYINSVRKNISDMYTSQDYKYYDGKFDLQPDHGTGNIVVLAPNGDAVSLTSTINLEFGSQFVSKSTGILLNCQMDDFSAPNITNIYGIHPSPANFIKPGKRPMSSLSPSIIVDENDNVRLVIGSGGGPKITTAVAYVTMMNLWFGKNIKEAIDEPRVHHQLMPMTLMYEYGLDEKAVENLQKIGHKVHRLTNDKSSHVTAISKENNIITSNCDYRWDNGDVAGF